MSSADHLAAGRRRDLDDDPLARARRGSSRARAGPRRARGRWRSASRPGCARGRARRRRRGRAAARSAGAIELVASRRPAGAGVAHASGPRRSRSRRVAPRGTASRSRACVRRCLARVPLLALLARQRPRQHQRADRHRGVGDVERPEAHVADADVDEVHDALRRAEAVERLPAAPPHARPSARMRIRSPRARRLDSRYSRHSTISAMSANAPKMYREYAPSDMLNAAPGLYASVNRTNSPMIRCGT